MAALLFILIILAVFHFLYESIFLPNHRLKLRYDLFTLRDELRDLKINLQGGINDKLFGIVDSSISNTIKYLPQINISLILKVEKIIETNEMVKKHVERRMEFVNTCDIPEVTKILARTSNIGLKALLLNTGGWFIYLIPIVILILAFKWLKDIIVQTIYVKDKELGLELDSYELASG